MLKSIRFLAAALSAAFLAFGTAFSATSPSTHGVFTSVTGKVQITSKSGAKTRTAQKGSTVVEGERIVTDKDSKATLQLFDGSNLDIDPNTDMALAKMQKPSAKDKILQFKLFVGSLFAKVQKLASAKSSFEIEAGGVVCGVRGTQYSYAYDPGSHKVTVHVDEGTVYLDANGQKYLFTAGQTGVFTNGKPQAKNPGPSSKPGVPGGNKTGASPSLADISTQFGQGLSVHPGNGSVNPIASNGGNVLANPNVEGALHLNVIANVPPAETVP